MLDTPNNLTLEEINYEESEPQSFSVLSQIKYEQKYSFLNDFSFNGDHLELSKIKMPSNVNQYQISFYQNQHETKETSHTLDEKIHSNAQLQHKIGSISLTQKDRIKEPIKLPLKNSPIFLEVASPLHSKLRGKLLKDSGESQIALFDQRGIEKGKLHYHLSKIYKKQEESDRANELDEGNTLHSKDFFNQIASIKKEIKDQMDKKEKLNDQSRVTLKSSVEDLPTQLNREKYIHKEVDDQDDSRSEKSEIDYMGYEGTSSKIEKRVGDYRLPLQAKHNHRQINKFIDYSQIKRRMEDLGLPSNNQIEKILYKSRINTEQIHEQSTKDQFPVAETPHLSFHDYSSQVQEIKPELIQCGIGTYTPLPSRLQDERVKSPKLLHIQQEQLARFLRERESARSIQEKKYMGLLKEQDYPISLREKAQKKQKSVDLPKLHFSRSKGRRVDTSLEKQSNKNDDSIIKKVSCSFEKQNQLSVRNKVYEIRVGSSRLQSRMYSHQSQRNDWISCKQNQSEHRLNLSSSQNSSILYPQFDLCINNLSVNFHKKSFGSKFVEISLPPTSYKTQELTGNNLIWIGKSYLFKGINGNNEISISVKKSSVQNVQQTLGEVKIRISDIIINKKRSYFQTFLLSKKQVLAIVIFGFEMKKKTFSISKQAFPVKVARQTHAQTQFSKSKTTKIKRKSQKKQGEEFQRDERLPSPRANPIRLRKYVGGKNIKIGKANRFLNDSLEVPGPGDYYIQSEFSRHAQKDL